MIEGFVFNNKTIEGYTFNPNATPGTSDFSYNVMYIEEQRRNISTNISKLQNNYKHINQDPKYNTLTFPDKLDLVKTTTDVRYNDINGLVLQQNYIYIVGSITCATLLIAAIIISKH